MSLITPFQRISAGALLALGLAMGLHGTAIAQSSKAAPVGASTFDVCEDSATGNWRYSGVVSALAAGDVALSVDYWVQNQTSRDGYRSVYKASKGGDGGTALRLGEATVVPFSVEAPALTLGTLRSEVRVQAGDTTPELILLQESTQAVCGCGPTGCVRSQGYWSNKPGVVWPNSWYRQMNFYSSGMNWQQLYDLPVRGNAYIMLAHQFMTAVLNRNTGASAPYGVQDVGAKARDWFASGTTLDTCGKGECAEQKAWAAILELYNSGNYPGAPKQCGD